MPRAQRTVLFLVTLACTAISLLSQAVPAKPSFDVVSIKPSPPDLGIRGGGPRGDRFTMTGASLKMLLQNAYQPFTSNGQPVGQIQVIGGPNWIDTDRYEIQAKADCTGGVIARAQMQLMLQSLLEDRFQLKAHMETRDLPIYNLVVAKDGPKVKASADQSPSTALPGGPPQLCGSGPIALPPSPPPPPPGGPRGGGFDLAAPAPRGAMMMMVNPAGMTMQATAVSLGNLINLLQQSLGRPVMDKTDLKGLFDFKLQFSAEGLALPFGPGGPGPGAGPGPGGPGGPTPTVADPAPSLFTAIQDLGLRLESSRGPVEVLVVDSAQKPAEN